MKEYNVYIDESGDEGIKRGSKFFILTAIIIEKKKDLKIENETKKLKEELYALTEKKCTQLHWNKLRSETKKKKVLTTIHNMPLNIINVIIDTDKMKFIPSIDLYNHFTGYLLERISWFIRDKQASANLFISGRGRLEKESLLIFLKKNSHFRIEYKRINHLEIIPNEQKNNLQLADCCCSALGQALRNNDTKHRKYIRYLKRKYYTYNNKYLGYGLKYVPNSREFPQEWKDLLEYLKK